MMKSVLLNIHSEVSEMKNPSRRSIDKDPPVMELSDVMQEFIPNEIDDAQEQQVEQTLNSIFDRGLIVNDHTNDETFDLKQYLETKDFQSAMKAGITANDLDEQEIPADVFQKNPDDNLVFADKFSMYYN